MAALHLEEKPVHGCTAVSRLLGLEGRPAELLGVSAIPLEKDHVEEMVTRCIVEVLSNALLKPNAPPINPQCKEILKKSARHDREEKKNENADEPLEVRHLKETGEDEKHQHVSVEEEQSQNEEQSKRDMEGPEEEKRHHEEDRSREEEEKFHALAQGHPSPEGGTYKEENNHQEEIRSEEEEKENGYKKHYDSEEESKENKHHDEDSKHELIDKKSHTAAKRVGEFLDRDDKRFMGHRHSEERVNSQESEEKEEEEEEEESSEQYHHESKERSFYQHRGHEESEEMEKAGEEKRRYRPKHYHRKYREGDFSEEKRDHNGEKMESSEETPLWDKRSHYQKRRYEEPEHHHEEKRGFHGRHSSEEVEEKRHAGHGSEEYRERWQSEESSEEVDKRHHHSEESKEKRHEDKRHHGGSHEAVRHHHEGRTRHSEDSEEDVDKHQTHGNRNEKRHHSEGRHHLQESEEEEVPDLYSRERKGQARHYGTEERYSEEKRHYLGNSQEEEEIEKSLHSEEQKQFDEDSMEKVRYGEKEEYKSHLPAETEKKATTSYGPFYSRLQWKSRHLEKKDNTRGQIRESEEEGRPTLSEKNFFPEYNDYDWWEKKQLLDSLNRGHSEKRNLGKIHKFDMKRQYSRMDQLAQLLNYRKKSAEFPELYSSGEDMKKRHVIRSDKGNLSQRPLTAEEEKELENLAAMDLELQKIAEKFNDNRRG
uniref:Secretogranin-1 n=2 Tax=Crocodylus porosus TaxID=8502 RepID=A0A7M4EXM4_CROPO